MQWIMKTTIVLILIALGLFIGILFFSENAEAGNPTISPWDLDMDAKTLSITGDENLDASTLVVGQITVQDAATLTTSYTLTDSTTASGDGTTIVIDLSSTDFNAIALDSSLATALGDSWLTIGNAIQSVSTSDWNVNIADGSGLQANSYVADSTDPALNSWTLNMNTGNLVLTFSEAVDASTLAVTGITVQDAASQTTTYTLTDSTTGSGDGTTIDITLSATDLNAVKTDSGLAAAIGTSYLTITTSVIDDMAANDVTAIADGSGLQAGSYTADTTDPALNSWTLNMNTGNLVLTFSEAVDASTLAVTGITVQDAASQTTTYTLTDSTTGSGDGTTIDITLSATDLNAIKTDIGLAAAIGTSYLTITTAVIDDMAANDVTAIADGSGLQAGSYTADTKAPTATVAVDTNLVYDGDLIQQVTVTYNEAMTSNGSADPIITFSDGTWNTNGDGTWYNGDTMWTENFTLTDNGEDVADVDVTIDSAEDVAGNTQVQKVGADAFNIDTENPLLNNDNSPNAGSTGDSYIFDISVSDSNGIASVNVTWAQGGLGGNVPMNNDGDGTWSLTITLDHSLSNLTYSIQVNDSSGNYIRNATETIPVYDNDNPSLANDNSPNSGSTGDNYVFDITVSDNIAVASVNVTWSHGGLSGNEALNDDGDGTWSLTITLDHSLSNLTYSIQVNDTSGNYTRNATETIPVYDNDNPSLAKDDSPNMGTTGDSYVFDVNATDNIGVASVNVTWSHGGLSGNVAMNNDGDGTWSLTITLDHSLSNLTYSIQVNDTSGNYTRNATETIPVYDNDNPSLAKDDSPNMGTTGDSYVFDVNVTDNIGVASVNVTWSHGGLSGNVALNNDGDGTWSLTITLDHSLSNLTYSIQVNDTSGNYTRNATETIPVYDNDNPSLAKDDSPNMGTTGDNYVFDINVTDNIGVASVNVTWSHGGLSGNEAMNDDGDGTWSLTITLDHSLSNLTYSIQVNDTSGNYTRNATETIPVYDNDNPSLIKDDSPNMGTTGDNYVFDVNVTDNIGVASVNVTWSHGGLGGNIALNDDGDGTWSLTITLDHSLSNLTYSIQVNDTSGNYTRNATETIPVYDNDNPALDNDNSPNTGTTGDNFLFDITVSDNIAVASVNVTWSHSGLSGNVALNDDGDGTWSLTITLDHSLSNLTYSIQVNDTSGNFTRNATETIQLSDNDSPSLDSDDSPNSGTTGDNFVFNITLSDNIAVPSVNVTWSHGGLSSNSAMNDDGDGTWSLTITLDHSVNDLYYSVQVNDSSGNYFRQSQQTVSVSDNDNPTQVSNDSPGTGTTGDAFTFDINLTDNIGVITVNVTWSHGGLGGDQAMNDDGDGTWSLTVNLDHNLGNMIYYYIARDNAGNSLNSGIQTVTVSDNDNPAQNYDNSSNMGTTGDSFIFDIAVSDNIAVGSINVTWTHGNLGGNKALNDDGDGTWSLTITLDHSLNNFNYSIQVNDTSGNFIRNATESIPVYDNDNPGTDNDNSPNSGSTGDNYVFDITVSDNIAVATVNVTWSHSGLGANEAMNDDGDGTWSLTITLDHSLSNLTYSIQVNDTSGNYSRNATETVPVYDNDNPSLVNDDSPNSGTSGANFVFDITVSDNIGIGSVNVTWSHGGLGGNEAMNNDGDGTWSLTITLDNSVGNLTYSIQVNDTSGNYSRNATETVSVADDANPTLDNDDSPDSGTTGDNYVFNITASDNVAVVSVNVTWAHGGLGGNVAMNDDGDGTWSLTITLDHSLSNLTYSIQVNDTSGNYSRNATETVPVYDNDNPNLDNDNSPNNGTTGDNYVFDITVSDNIGVASVNVTWSHGGLSGNDAMNNDGDGTWSLTITIDHSLSNLTYSIQLNDTSGNYTRNATETITVYDNDNPTLDNDNSPNIGTTGDNYLFDITGSDNVGIGSVNVSWYHGGLSGNDAMNNDGDGTWSLTITLDHSLSNLTYSIQVNDTSGNYSRNATETITVYDNDNPSFAKDDSPIMGTTGDNYVFDVNVTDNIGVASVNVTWSHGGLSGNNAMNNDGDGTWSLTIILDHSLSNLSYSIQVNDTSGNYSRNATETITVYDNDNPSLAKDDSPNMGTTGDNYVFDVNVTDNIGVASVNVTWSHGGLSGNNAMNNDGDGTWSLTITLDHSLSNLTYSIQVNDTSGNYSRNATEMIRVYDNDNPTLDNDNSPNSGTTGDNYVFNITVSDNIGIASVNVTWSHGGLSGNEPMNNYGNGTWTLTISLDQSVSNLTYSIQVNDTSSNYSRNATEIITVFDNDNPTLDNDDSPNNGTTGDNFVFDIAVSDNMGVASVNVTWSHGARGGNEAMNNDGDGTWSLTITLDHSLSNLTYSIQVNDTSGNYTRNATETIPVYDNDNPSLVNDDSPNSGTTGDNYEFNITVSDNIGIAGVNVTWSHGGLSGNDAMNNDGDGTWSLTITLDHSLSNLTYSIQVNDTSGNYTRNATEHILVYDNDIPGLANDDSPNSGTTGDSYIFNITVSDNIGVATVNVTWSHGGLSNNEAMNDDGDGTWSLTITLDHSLSNLTYSIQVNDTSGNYSRNATETVSVSDNDIPSIVKDDSLNNGTTGDNYVFNITVSDNIAVAGLNVTWSHGGLGGNEAMNDDGDGTWSLTIILDHSLSDLTYSIQINDSTGNYHRNATETISIYDNDDPSIDNDSSSNSGTTGDSYVFDIRVTDNIGVASVNVTWSHGGLSGNTALNNDGDGTWSLTITLDHSLSNLVYSIQVNDTSGNYSRNATETIPVFDNDNPSVNNDDSPNGGTTGDSFVYDITVSDNIAVASVNVSWTHGGRSGNDAMNNDGDGTWSLTITLDHSIADLTYSIQVNDTSGNFYRNATETVSISDDDNPILINDNSANSGTTGDNYVFNITVSDNVHVAGVNVTWSHGNISENIALSDDGDGTWSLTITLDHNLSNLTYSIQVNDSSGNYNRNETETISVSDNDSPQLIGDDSPFTGTTGDNYTFNISATDNIDVDVIFVNWTHGNRSGNQSLERGQGYWFLSIVLDDDLGDLIYKIFVNDTSQNIDIGPQWNVLIQDNDAPLFDSDSSPAVGYTGDYYRFNITASDNIDVLEVSVNYSHGKLGDNVSLFLNDGYWSTTILLDDSLANLNYYVIISDTSNNYNLSSLLYAAMIDNDIPLLLKDNSGNTATTGDDFHFNISAFDNIGISAVHINYSHWADGGNVSLNNIEGYWHNTIRLEHNLELITYVIHMEDTSGNINKSGLRTVKVYDNDLPSLISDETTGDPTTGDQYMVLLDAGDNIGVNSVTLRYTFDDTNYHIEPMIPNIEDLWYVIIDVPTDANFLLYFFHIRDSSGNYLNISQPQKTVEDNDAPSINEILMGPPETGEILDITINVSDNMDVISVSLRYSFDGSEYLLSEFEYKSFGIWTSSIRVSNAALFMNYSFVLRDLSLNEHTSEYFQIEVYDVIDPVARVKGDIIIDQHRTAFFDGGASTDNLDIKEYIWTFLYDDIEQELNGTETFFKFDSAGRYLITLKVSDFYNNWDLNHFNVTVTDTTLPVAEAGDDVYIAVHDRVCFNGTGSSDNLGVAEWSWSFFYGGVIVELHGNRTCYTFDNHGDYLVNLRIRDAAGLESTDSLTVYVGVVITTEIGEGNVTEKSIKDQFGNVVANVRVSGNGTLYVKKMEWNEVSSKVDRATGNTLDLGLFLEIELEEFDWIYIEIPYSDSDIPPGVDVKSMKLYFWNESASKWEVIEKSGVDLTRKVVWGNITHLTIFAPLAVVEETDVEEGLSSRTVLFAAIIVVLVIMNIVFIVMVLRKRGGAGDKSKDELGPDDEPLEVEEISAPICAECGEEIPDYSEFCPHCGVAVESEEDEKVIKDDEKKEKKEIQVEEKKEDKVEDKDRKKKDTFVDAPEEKNVCPECWEDLSSGDKVCIHCGYTPLTDGEPESEEDAAVDEEKEIIKPGGKTAKEIDEVFDEIEDISMEDAVQEAAEKVLEQGVASEETEKIIGELAARVVDTGEISEDEPIESVDERFQPVDEQADSAWSEETLAPEKKEDLDSKEPEYGLAIIEEEKTVLRCPDCEAFITPGDSICVSCGAELSKWVDQLDRLGAELDELDMEEEEEESGKVVGMLEEAMESAKDIEVKLFENYEIEYQCPICENIVEEDTSFCPNCGIRYEDEKASLSKWTDDEVSLGLKGRYLEADEDYDFEIIFNPQGSEKNRYITISSPTKEKP